jgi:hypothetical protein
MSDFKSALERFDSILTKSEPDANGKILGRYGKPFMRDDEIANVRKALRIADRLQSGQFNLDGINFPLPNIHNQFQDYEIQDFLEQVAAQMIKEVSDD